MYKNYIRSILAGNKFHEADTGTGIGGSSEGQGDGSGDNKDSSEGGNTGLGNEGNDGGSEGSKSKSKSFTQDDVNNLVARETKKATEKILKQLGVTDFKSAKEGLDKFKEIQDSQKTDVEKAIGRATDLEKTNNDLATQVSSLSSQLAALKADVNPDSLNDVIVLADNLVTDEVTIDDAIQQVLKKYPNFKRTVGANNSGDKKQAPKFTEGQNNPAQKQNESDAWANAFNFNRK